MNATQGLQTLLPIATRNPPANPTPSDNAGHPGNDAWQRAIDGAATGAPQSAASTDEARYLFDLNGLGAAPAHELPLSRASAPQVLQTGRTSVASLPNRSQPASRNPLATSQSPAASSAHEREWQPPVRERPTTVAHDLKGQGPAVAISKVRSNGSGRTHPIEGRPVTLSSSAPTSSPAVAGASPSYAIGVYAAAMSTAPQASDAGTSFSVTGGPSRLPVRVHVQWRGPLADVWIGLHRDALARLPDVRAAVVDWVRTRGGVIDRLVCNGETLAGNSNPLSFQGAL
ncbi:MAG: hypothetical protein ABJD97_00950 [Betaproteobacteria bacterium]